MPEILGYDEYFRAHSLKAQGSMEIFAHIPTIFDLLSFKTMLGLLLLLAAVQQNSFADSNKKIVHPPILKLHRELSALQAAGLLGERKFLEEMGRAEASSCSDPSNSVMVQKYRQQNRNYVNWCLKNMNDDTEFNTLGFRMMNSGGQIRFDVRIRFQLDKEISASRAKEMLKTERACLPALRAIWARYGINFNVVIDSNRSPIDVDWVTPAAVQLSDGQGRATSAHYFYEGLPGNPASELRSKACWTLAHETGHMMGLGDHYPEAGQNRSTTSYRTKPPINMMAQIWNAYPDWEKVDFFPTEIASILRRDEFCKDLPSWYDLGVDQ